MVLFAQYLVPVGSVEQDEDPGLGSLEERVEQREHVESAHQLWREGQLQDGCAQLHVLAAGFQGDGAATRGRQAEQGGEAIPSSVPAQRHEHCHGVHGGTDRGQQVWTQHHRRQDEEQN
ncbi:hypothetical protein GJAV_G00071720 [Gymnothorax javanicus]|nr:hypothetical protein GJAV_G00071720 [Gymnothorax javanicus]